MDFSPWIFHETQSDWKQLHYQGLLVNGCVKIPEVKAVTAAPHITLHFSSISQHRAEVIFLSHMVSLYLQPRANAILFKCMSRHLHTQTEYKTQSSSTHLHIYLCTHMRDLCIMDALKKPLLILKILPPPVICSIFEWRQVSLHSLLLPHTTGRHKLVYISIMYL